MRGGLLYNICRVGGERERKGETERDIMSPFDPGDSIRAEVDSARNRSAVLVLHT